MQNWRRSLIIAGVISIGFHGIFILGLDNDVREHNEPVRPPLEARLTPIKPVEQIKPIAASPVPKKSEPSRTERKKKEVITPIVKDEAEGMPVVASTEVIPDESAQLDEVLPPTSSDQPIVTETPKAIVLPQRLLIRFSASWNGMNVGKADYRWERRGTQYSLDAFTKTSGLVGFFKSMWISQSSNGEITDKGLQPTHFISQYSYRPSEGAEFDWTTKSLTLSVDNVSSKTVTLLPGTQDLMSVLFQLAFTPPLDSMIEVAVVTGKKMDTYKFFTVGEETLTLSFGAIKTLHVRRPKTDSDDGLDVWLAVDRHYLPVKIIRFDRKDSRPIELLASELLVSSETIEEVSSH